MAHSMETRKVSWLGVRHLGVGLLGMTLCGEGVARAGGLQVGDVGSQGMERAGAFVVKADDPTALFYNPAGLVKARRWQLYLGSNLIDGWQSFKRSGVYEPHSEHAIDEPQHAYVGQEYPTVENAGAAQAVPFLGASRSFGSLALGAGVFGPSANANRDYSSEITLADGTVAPAPQRYDVISQEAIVALPSMAAAYRVLPGLAVGARASWGYASLKARSTVWAMAGNQEEDPAGDADYSIDGSDPFIFNWSAGALAEVTSWLEVGAAYTSPISMHVEGNSRIILGELMTPPGQDPDYVEPVDDDRTWCGTGGTVDEIKGCIDMKLPQNLTVGGRLILRDRQGREKGDLELDVRWEDWSSASDITVLVDGRDHIGYRRIERVKIRHGFQDVIAVRLGGSYRPDLLARSIELRGGLSYDSATAPVSWTRLDIDGQPRFLGSVGVAIDLTHCLRLDAGAAYVYEPDRTVTDVDVGADPAVADRVQPDPILAVDDANDQVYDPMNAGEYASGYAVGSVGLTLTW